MVHSALRKEVSERSLFRGIRGGTMVNRKLIRPTLSDVKEQPPSKFVDGQRKRVPPEVTNAEQYYYLKQMSSKTPMVIKLDAYFEKRRAKAMASGSPSCTTSCTSPCSARPSSPRRTDVPVASSYPPTPSPSCWPLGPVLCWPESGCSAVW